MAEIINIPNFGEARLPLNEYDKMRDRIVRGGNGGGIDTSGDLEG